jgi:hypothetical protein
VREVIEVIILQFTKPHNLMQLHQELIKEGLDPILVEGKEETGDIRLGFADNTLSELVQLAIDIVQRHVPAPPPPPPPDPKEVFFERVSSLDFNQASSLEELKPILSELKAALLELYQ